MKRLRLICLIFIASLTHLSFAQVRQSPTPITVNLVTPTPIANQQVVTTVTPTFTPTAVGPVLLEVRESAGVVNVRAEPDPNSDRLGTIEFGTQYPVLRQYFQWYEFQYELSPSGRAWVYGELVDIIGEASEIEIVDTLDEPSNQTNLENQTTETALAITSIPGARETATAGARVLSVPTVASDSDSLEVENLTPFPTFTYPAEGVTIASNDNIVNIPRSSQGQSTDRIPPVFPIVMLGGFGIVGLLISSLRR